MYEIIKKELEKYKLSLVFWHGGGYDGCIWEPNMGFIDDECEWHPVISTGYGAIDDDLTLISAIEEMEKAKDETTDFDGNYRHWEYFKILPLNQESADWFCKNVRNDFVARFFDNVNECVGYENEIMMICTECGKHFSSPDYSYTDLSIICQEAGYYRGDGGIGTICDTILCEDCKYDKIDSVHEDDWVYLSCYHNEKLREYSGKSYMVRRVGEDGETYDIIVGEDEEGEEIIVSVPADYCEKNY